MENPQLKMAIAIAVLELQVEDLIKCVRNQHTQISFLLDNARADIQTVKTLATIINGLNARVTALEKRPLMVLKPSLN